MAGETAQPGGATRYIQTTQGLLSYSQLAPLLAARVLRVEQRITANVFSDQMDFPDLILQLHREMVSDLVPEWAGRWRNADVRVGEHHPPPSYRIPVLMKDYGEDLRVRLENVSQRLDDLLLETLAFAEGRLLSIHPFLDFNGRVARLFLRELLRRLNLPPIDLIPSAALQHEYRSALRAGDVLDWHPLMQHGEVDSNPFTNHRNWDFRCLSLLLPPTPNAMFPAALGWVRGGDEY